MGTPPVHAARSSATDLDVVLYRHTLSRAGAAHDRAKGMCKKKSYRFFWIFLEENDLQGERFWESKKTLEPTVFLPNMLGSGVV
jgi:hypothetical protein